MQCTDTRYRRRMDDARSGGTPADDAPVTCAPDEFPDDQREEFRFDPSLVLFEGPWMVLRSPGLGTAVRVAGIVFLLVVVTGVVVDGTVGPGLLDVNGRMAALILGGLFAAGVFAAGSTFFRGRAIHVPSGRRYSRTRIDSSGTCDFAAKVHAEVVAGAATADSVRGDGRIGPDIGSVQTRVYECAKAAEVWATVRFIAPDGTVTAWPPVPITFDEAIELRPVDNSHTVVDSVAIGN